MLRSLLDILARVSVYLLSDPSPSFMQLLRPLLKPQILSATLVVILLDWAQPLSWLRQLRDWIQQLRILLLTLEDDCKEVMERVMNDWRDRGHGSGGLPGGNRAALDGGVSIPLGPGEWNDPLGLPLCVVCQNVSLGQWPCRLSQWLID